jgi:hypothetical protein
VAKPPGAPGNEVTTGTLYRLVPNWDTHWNYEAGLPEPRAFRKDGDIGVSMVRSDRITPDGIFEKKPTLANFAVCEISIEDLLADKDVWVIEDPDEDFGDAHVIVMGITKRRVDWLCDLASRRIIKQPGAAKPPMHHGDEPRK